jgi:hypothetical protein
VKILALGFLIMIGMALVADSFGAHAPKGYLYTAMAFSIFIECINMLQRPRRKPIHLRNVYGPEHPEISSEVVECPQAVPGMAGTN